MKKQEYRELLTGNKLQKHVLPIFEALEKYVEHKTEYTSNVLNEISESLNNTELRSHISEIGKEARKSELSILNTYVISLQRNVADYIKMDNREQSVRRGKLKKLLYSYINVTRYVIDYERLEEIINRGPQGSEIIVLAIGLVDPDNDNINVNEEIQYIVDSSKANKNYFVIPVYGCSTDVFASINRKVHADIVHMAGHGDNSNGRNVIYFVDSHMTYRKFQEKLVTKRELIVLNCCYTYEYVNGCAIPVSNYSIVHKGPVWSDIAYEFSQKFYDELWRTGNLIRAWNNAKKVEHPLMYYFL